MATRSPGRPRSESARRAILGATTELIERDGYGRVTMESIARHAGVSKQTVYRWWPTKATILLEALNEGAAAISPLRDTGAFRADVRTFVRSTVAGAGRNARLLAALMAEAQFDQDLAVAFRTGFLARRRDVLAELLERGRNSGELAVTADTEFLVELVFATLWYRILAQNRPLSRAFADRLTDSVLTLGAVE
jgi:AcrR family transcriptional regulator